MNGKDPKPPQRVTIKPMKLSSRPSTVRPARPSPSLRPSGPSRRGVLPPGYGIPDWQKGIIKFQNLLSQGAQRVKETVQQKGSKQSSGRDKGWQTRRQKYGKSGRKS